VGLPPEKERSATDDAQTAEKHGGFAMDRRLRDRARALRKGMTESERRLWQGLRHRRLGVRFLRQKVLAGYIVDFYAAEAGLVVEVDGGQHWEAGHAARDRRRDERLRGLGLEVLRFPADAVLRETAAVLEAIAETVRRRLAEGGGRLPRRRRGGGG